MWHLRAFPAPSEMTGPWLRRERVRWTITVQILAKRAGSMLTALRRFEAGRWDAPLAWRNDVHAALREIVCERAARMLVANAGFEQSHRLLDWALRHATGRGATNAAHKRREHRELWSAA